MKPLPNIDSYTFMMGGGIQVEPGVTTKIVVRPIKGALIDQVLLEMSEIADEYKHPCEMHFNGCFIRVLPDTSGIEVAKLIELYNNWINSANHRRFVA